MSDVFAIPTRGEYPLPVYNYLVRIEAEAYGFSQVSGLNIQYQTITYRHGLSLIEGAHYIQGILEPIDITLEKGILETGSTMLEWISSGIFESVKKRDVTIELLDEAGNPVVGWTALNAFPTSLQAPNLNASSDEVAIEQVRLRANGLSIKYYNIDYTGGTTGAQSFAKTIIDRFKR